MSQQRINKALALVSQVGSRTISHDTMRRYKRVFVSLWCTVNLDPLRPGDARDTFQFRVAALHAVGAWWLARLSRHCYEAAERQDLIAARRWSKILHRVIERLEPAFARDPPLQAGTSPLSMPASRWQTQDSEKPTRGETSKRQLLCKLPRDWQDRVWFAVPGTHTYQMHIAVLILVPIRSEEFMPREMPWDYSPGVVIEVDGADRLLITVDCAKWLRKDANPTRVTVLLDVEKAGAIARFLHQQASRAGGRDIISIKSKDSLRTSVAAVGRAALPELSENLTPSVYRHQAIADLKATFGGGGMVAAAAGQGSDRMQAKYGRFCHGRKRLGIIDIRSSCQPTVGNVARAHALAHRFSQSQVKTKTSDQ